MSKLIKLYKAVNYSDKRIKADEVLLKSYISTDNILPNKSGITTATNLPPGKNAMPGYKTNNILVSNIRPYLKKIWHANRDGGCSADVLVFEAKDGFDSKFLYYSIFRDDFFIHVMNGSKGTKMPRGDKTQILEFEIPNYDLSNQTNIAKVLSALDSKTELNNRINTELEAMVKLIYDYWFVQFDFPDAKGKPYKSSGGKMIWNEKLKREIPEGWDVVKIDDLLNTSLGGTPSTKVKEFWDQGTINWLNSGEIANFPVLNSELKITKEAIENSATELLPKGTTLLSITRHLRPTILAIDACVNQSVVGLKEKGEIRFYFLYPYLKNEIPRLMTLRTGAQQPHINKEIVDSSLILIPDENSPLLKIYNKKVGPLYELIISNSLQNQKLVELRDWLLPMLMNGQVSVSEANEKKEEDITLQLAYIVAVLGEVLKPRGEVVQHKTAWFLNYIFYQALKIKFQNDNFGTFSPELRDALSSNPYLIKENSTDKGFPVYKLKQESKSVVFKAFESKTNSSFRNSVHELMEIYSDPIINKKTDQIELLNTVCKIIQDNKTTDLKSIRKYMKEWKTPKSKHKNKAEKFSEPKTKKILDFIIDKGWNKKLIN